MLLNPERLTGGKFTESELDADTAAAAVKEDEPLPLLPGKDVTGNTEPELSVLLAVAEAQQTGIFGLIRESDLVNIVPEEKQTPDVHVDITDQKTQMAIEQVVAELDGKAMRDVTHRLQQQEREWVPEQEHSLEKTFGE